MTGRTRDDGIDARILAVAGRHLARHGYAGMSLAAVAAEAETTRQALYRRWPTKAALADAVVATLGPADTPAPPHAFDALVAELTAFSHDITRPGRLSLVGTMLQDTTDLRVLDRYRRTVIAPRRSRLRVILESARAAGEIDAGADLEVALTMCTGSWYGRALAGEPVPGDWPRRTAALVWRALGGVPPGP